MVLVELKTQVAFSERCFSTDNTFKSFNKSEIRLLVVCERALEIGRFLSGFERVFMSQRAVQEILSSILGWGNGIGLSDYMFRLRFGQSSDRAGASSSIAVEFEHLQRVYVIA